MISPAPVTLEGRHVRLEPLSLGHLPALAEVGLDPELWRWTVTQATTPAELERYVRDALADAAGGRAIPFATVALAAGRAVGSTRFANVSVPDGRLEIGWTWVGREHQRTVVNTEAKYLMLRHAFEALGCTRVEFKTDALNDRSRAALLRIGAVEEGTLRRHMRRHDGRLRDSVYFSVIDAEWPAVRARFEARLEARFEARLEARLDPRAGA